MVSPREGRDYGGRHPRSVWYGLLGCAVLASASAGFDTGTVEYSPPFHGYIRCNYDHAVQGCNGLQMHVTGCVGDLVFRDGFGE